MARSGLGLDGARLLGHGWIPVGLVRLQARERLNIRRIRWDHHLRARQDRARTERLHLVAGTSGETPAGQAPPEGQGYRLRIPKPGGQAGGLETRYHRGPVETLPRRGRSSQKREWGWP